MSSSGPKGPYTLVTVNTAPERAKRLIGRVVEDLKDRYTINYLANCEKIEEVEPTVKKLQPDLLVRFLSVHPSPSRVIDGSFVFFASVSPLSPSPSSLHSTCLSFSLCRASQEVPVRSSATLTPHVRTPYHSPFPHLPLRPSLSRGLSVYLTSNTPLQFCASMWTPEESTRIQQIARDNVPGIKTHAIPEGLQVQKGPDAVVEHLKEQIPGLLD